MINYNMETRAMCFEAKRLLKLAVGPALMLMSAVALAYGPEANQVNMAPGVTAVGENIFSLHMVILIICTVIGVVVFGVMFYSIIYHRKSKGAVASHFHESTKVEIAWTVVPFFILIAMAVPATSSLLAVYNTDDAELDIIVTGFQWKWKYEYIDESGQNVSFFSNLRTPQSEIRNSEPKGEHYLLEVDEPLVIPVDTKVRFLVTANDVIHSWWVPELAVKRDAIPGFINEAWTKVHTVGVYRGQCAELCGKDHGFMPIVVEVKSEADYQAWLAGRKARLALAAADADKVFGVDELKARGEKIYAANCAACHQADGKGLPGVFPGLAGSKVATGPAAAHIDLVLRGKAGTAMAAYKDQLNDADLAAVLTYERAAWGNAADAVQPAHVKARRD